MIVLNKSVDISTHLNELKLVDNQVVVGFVPTMGALHEGHLALIKEAKKQSSIVVCSIFVNPTQFNNPEDLKKYPRNIQQDIELLKSVNCDIVYTPDVEDVYPNNIIYEKLNLNFGIAASKLEGSFRPGHFDGVAQVVKRLFDIVSPEIAFFGQKDFQQTVIIKSLVSILNLPIKIVVVDTLRNEFGLALSSRNTLLSAKELDSAQIIYKTLKFGKDLTKSNKNPNEVREKMVAFFNKGDLKLEYLEFVHSDDFSDVVDFQKSVTCCIAAFCGNVRLIDNLEIFSKKA